MARDPKRANQQSDPDRGADDGVPASGAAEAPGELPARTFRPVMHGFGIAAAVVSLVPLTLAAYLLWAACGIGICSDAEIERFNTGCGLAAGLRVLFCAAGFGVGVLGVVLAALARVLIVKGRGHRR